MTFPTLPSRKRILKHLKHHGGIYLLGSLVYGLANYHPSGFWGLVACHLAALTGAWAIHGLKRI